MNGNSIDTDIDYNNIKQIRNDITLILQKKN